MPCERGFSTQNRILNRLRTSLSNKVLNDLMIISENGSHINHLTLMVEAFSGRVRKQERCIGYLYSIYKNKI